MKKEEDLVTISEIIDFISESNEILRDYINDIDSEYYFDIKYSYIEIPEEYKSVVSFLNNADYDPNLTLRVRRWLDFFYNKYADSILMLEPTIFAVFSEAVSSRFFYNQTNYEVSLSLKFYESYFKTKRNPLKYDYKMALFLLKMSLFYSKYYGFQQQSLSVAFDKINKDFSLNGMAEMFKCLFCKYEMPNALLKCFPKLEDDGYSILAQIILGKNLRTIEELPLKMSKKENFVFLNKIPDYIEFEDNHLKRLLVFTKILKINIEEIELLNNVLGYSNTFKYRLSTFIEDLSFWQDAFRFLIKIDYDVNIGIREFVDFFEYHRYFSEQEPFSFKGRTVNSVIRLITEWHGATLYKRDLELISKKWDKIKKSNFKIKYNDEQFVFKQIDNGKDLYKESKALKHCVFSYIRDCINGYTSIWSMQKVTKRETQRILTIEIYNNEIVQVSGKHNRPITTDEEILLKRFAEFNELKINIMAHLNHNI